jgi:hypothetical protein
MNRLLKLSEAHYIVVNNSEIKKGDLCYDKEGNPGYNNIKYIVKCLRTDSNSYWNKYCKKITHSTQPLESNNLYRKLDFINIKPLSLSEVEEVIKDNHSENNEWNVYFDENDKMLIMNV